MKIRTNSDAIRDCLLSIIRRARFMINLHNSHNQGSTKMDLNATLYANIVDEEIVSDSLIKQFIDEDSIKLTHVVKALQQVIFLSDYYIFSTYKLRTQNDANEAFSIENALKSIREKAFGYITKSLDIVTMAKAIEEIKNASFYKKIVIFNSLDYTDIEFLCTINPFFEEEYKLYRLEVTPEFIIEEINKQNETNLPNEAVYQELARLLADLYRVDEDLINDIVADMIETLNMNGNDVGVLIGILDSDNAHDIDQVLASLIEQYYMIKKDEKKYEK